MPRAQERMALAGSKSIQLSPSHSRNLALLNLRLQAMFVAAQAVARISRWSVARTASVKRSCSGTNSAIGCGGSRRPHSIPASAYDVLNPLLVPA